MIKSLCAPDDYSTMSTQSILNRFNHLPCLFGKN
jgi:hypothetical protein